MKNVFITGVSGYIGSKLASYLDKKENIRKVVGIDIKPPSVHYPKLHFISYDVRNDFSDLLFEHKIDWAIHAAFVVPPIHNKILMEDINIKGSKNFLNLCAEAGIQQLLICSSTSAFGFHADNPPLLAENSPLRGNDDFTYTKNKRELEFICEEFRHSNPSVRLIIARPCLVFGPTVDNPYSRYVLKKTVLTPRNPSHLQFIHEDDLVEIMYRLLLEGKDGAYNLVSDGTIMPHEMVKLIGGRILELPAFLIYPLTDIFWNLRLKLITEFPSPVLSAMRYPWIASNKKVKEELSYTFKYTSEEVIEDFARHKRR